MTGRRFMALLVGALAVITFAFWLSTQRYLPRDRSFGTPVLGALEPTIDEVRGIRIVGAGDVTLVTLERPEGRWRVVERDYAADSRRVRALLSALGELQVLSRATQEAAQFARFGVEDVADAGAAGVRIELRGSDGPRALVVGRAADATSSYVRVQGAGVAVVATPRIDVAREPDAWLARTIVDVAAARVQSFELAPDGAAPRRAERLSRADELPADALAGLEFEAVTRDIEPHAGPSSHATYRTFDGLVLRFTGRTEGDRRWLRVEAAEDPALAARFPAGAGDDAPGIEQVHAEAERIATTTRGWWYGVGPDRYDLLFGTLASPPGPRGAP